MEEKDLMEKKKPGRPAKVQVESGMKPFTTSEELPPCKVRHDKRKDVDVFAEYGEARYFLRMVDGGYELIKVYRKLTSVIRRHVRTFKLKNAQDKAYIKRLKIEGIPVID
jgi:hypothetical protein